MNASSRILDTSDPLYEAKMRKINDRKYAQKLQKAKSTVDKDNYDYNRNRSVSPPKTARLMKRADATNSSKEMRDDSFLYSNMTGVTPLLYRMNSNDYDKWMANLAYDGSQTFRDSRIQTPIMFDVEQRGLQTARQEKIMRSLQKTNLTMQKRSTVNYDFDINYELESNVDKIQSKSKLNEFGLDRDLTGWRYRVAKQKFEMEARNEEQQIKNNKRDKAKKQQEVKLHSIKNQVAARYDPIESPHRQKHINEDLEEITNTYKSEYGNRIDSYRQRTHSIDKKENNDFNSERSEREAVNFNRAVSPSPRRQKHRYRNLDEEQNNPIIWRQVVRRDKNMKEFKDEKAKERGNSPQNNKIKSDNSNKDRDGKSKAGNKQPDNQNRNILNRNYKDLYIEIPSMRINPRTGQPMSQKYSSPEVKYYRNFPRNIEDNSPPDKIVVKGLAQDYNQPSISKKLSMIRSPKSPSQETDINNKESESSFIQSPTIQYRQNEQQRYIREQIKPETVEIGGESSDDQTSHLADSSESEHITFSPVEKKEIDSKTSLRENNLGEFSPHKERNIKSPSVAHDECSPKKEENIKYNHQNVYTPKEDKITSPLIKSEIKPKSFSQHTSPVNKIIKETKSETDDEINPFKSNTHLDLTNSVEEVEENEISIKQLAEIQPRSPTLAISSPEMSESPKKDQKIQFQTFIQTDIMPEVSPKAVITISEAQSMDKDSEQGIEEHNTIITKEATEDTVLIRHLDENDIEEPKIDNEIFQEVKMMITQIIDQKLNDNEQQSEKETIQNGNDLIIKSREIPDSLNNEAVVKQTNIENKEFEVSAETASIEEKQNIEEDIKEIQAHDSKDETQHETYSETNQQQNDPSNSNEFIEINVIAPTIPEVVYLNGQKVENTDEFPLASTNSVESKSSNEATDVEEAKQTKESREVEEHSLEIVQTKSTEPKETTDVEEIDLINQVKSNHEKEAIDVAKVSVNVESREEDPALEIESTNQVGPNPEKEIGNDEYQEEQRESKEIGESNLEINPATSIESREVEEHSLEIVQTKSAESKETIDLTKEPTNVESREEESALGIESTNQVGPNPGKEIEESNQENIPAKSIESDPKKESNGDLEFADTKECESLEESMTINGSSPTIESNHLEDTLSTNYEESNLLIESANKDDVHSDNDQSKNTEESNSEIPIFNPRLESNIIEQKTEENDKQIYDTIGNPSQNEKIESNEDDNQIENIPDTEIHNENIAGLKTEGKDENIDANDNQPQDLREETNALPRDNEVLAGVTDETLSLPSKETNTNQVPIIDEEKEVPVQIKERSLIDNHQSENVTNDNKSETKDLDVSQPSNREILNTVEQESNSIHDIEIIGLSQENKHDPDELVKKENIDTDSNNDNKSIVLDQNQIEDEPNMLETEQKEINQCKDTEIEIKENDDSKEALLTNDSTEIDNNVLIQKVTDLLSTKEEDQEPVEVESKVEKPKKKKRHHKKETNVSEIDETQAKDITKETVDSEDEINNNSKSEQSVQEQKVDDITIDQKESKTSEVSIPIVSQDEIDMSNNEEIGTTQNEEPQESNKTKGNSLLSSFTSNIASLCEDEEDVIKSTEDSENKHKHKKCRKHIKNQENNDSMEERDIKEETVEIPEELTEKMIIGPSGNDDIAEIKEPDVEIEKVDNEIASNELETGKSTSITQSNDDTNEDETNIMKRYDSLENGACDKTQVSKENRDVTKSNLTEEAKLEENEHIFCLDSENHTKPENKELDKENKPKEINASSGSKTDENPHINKNKDIDIESNDEQVAGKSLIEQENINQTKVDLVNNIEPLIVDNAQDESEDTEEEINIKTNDHSKNDDFGAGKEKDELPHQMESNSYYSSNVDKDSETSFNESNKAKNHDVPKELPNTELNEEDDLLQQIEIMKESNEQEILPVTISSEEREYENEEGVSTNIEAAIEESIHKIVDQSKSQEEIQDTIQNQGFLNSTEELENISKKDQLKEIKHSDSEQIEIKESNETKPLEVTTHNENSESSKTTQVQEEDSSSSKDILQSQASTKIETEVKEEEYLGNEKHLKEEEKTGNNNCEIELQTNDITNEFTNSGKEIVPTAREVDNSESEGLSEQNNGDLLVSTKEMGDEIQIVDDEVIDVEDTIVNQKPKHHKSKKSTSTSEPNGAQSSETGQKESIKIEPHSNMVDEQEYVSEDKKKTESTKIAQKAQEVFSTMEELEKVEPNENSKTKKHYKSETIGRNENVIKDENEPQPKSESDREEASDPISKTEKSISHYLDSNSPIKDESNIDQRNENITSESTKAKETIIQKQSIEPNEESPIQQISYKSIEALSDEDKNYHKSSEDSDNICDDKENEIKIEQKEYQTQSIDQTLIKDDPTNESLSSEDIQAQANEIHQDLLTESNKGSIIISKDSDKDENKIDASQTKIDSVNDEEGKTDSHSLIDNKESSDDHNKAKKKKHLKQKNGEEIPVEDKAVSSEEKKDKSNDKEVPTNPISMFGSIVNSLMHEVSDNSSYKDATDQRKATQLDKRCDNSNELDKEIQILDLCKEKDENDVSYMPKGEDSYKIHEEQEKYEMKYITPQQEGDSIICPVPFIPESQSTVVSTNKQNNTEIIPNNDNITEEGQDIELKQVSESSKNEVIIDTRAKEEEVIDKQITQLSEEKPIQVATHENKVSQEDKSEYYSEDSQTKEANVAKVLKPEEKDQTIIDNAEKATVGKASKKSKHKHTKVTTETSENGQKESIIVPDAVTDKRVTQMNGNDSHDIVQQHNVHNGTTNIQYVINQVVAPDDKRYEVVKPQLKSIDSDEKEKQEFEARKVTTIEVDYSYSEEETVEQINDKKEGRVGVKDENLTEKDEPNKIKENDTKKSKNHHKSKTDNDINEDDVIDTSIEIENIKQGEEISFGFKDDSESEEKMINESEEEKQNSSNDEQDISKSISKTEESAHINPIEDVNNKQDEKGKSDDQKLEEESNNEKNQMEKKHKNEPKEIVALTNQNEIYSGNDCERETEKEAITSMDENNDEETKKKKHHKHKKESSFNILDEEQELKNEKSKESGKEPDEIPINNIESEPKEGKENPSNTESKKNKKYKKLYKSNDESPQNEILIPGEDLKQSASEKDAKDSPETLSTIAKSLAMFDDSDDNDKKLKESVIEENQPQIKDLNNEENNDQKKHKKRSTEIKMKGKDDHEPENLEILSDDDENSNKEGKIEIIEQEEALKSEKEVKDGSKKKKKHNKMPKDEEEVTLEKEIIPITSEGETIETTMKKSIEEAEDKKEIVVIDLTKEEIELNIEDSEEKTKKNESNPNKKAVIIPVIERDESMLNQQENEIIAETGSNEKQDKQEKGDITNKDKKKKKHHKSKTVDFVNILDQQEELIEPITGSGKVKTIDDQHNKEDLLQTASQENNCIGDKEGIELKQDAKKNEHNSEILAIKSVKIDDDDKNLETKDSNSIDNTIENSNVTDDSENCDKEKKKKHLKSKKEDENNPVQDELVSISKVITINDQEDSTETSEKRKKKHHKSKEINHVVVNDGPLEESAEQLGAADKESEEAADNKLICEEVDSTMHHVNLVNEENILDTKEEKTQKKKNKHDKKGDESDSSMIADKSIKVEDKEEKLEPKESDNANNEEYDLTQSNEQDNDPKDKTKKKKHLKNKKEEEKIDSSIITANAIESSKSAKKDTQDDQVIKTNDEGSTNIDEVKNQKKKHKKSKDVVPVVVIDEQKGQTDGEDKEQKEKAINNQRLESNLEETKSDIVMPKNKEIEPETKSIEQGKEEYNIIPEGAVDDTKKQSDFKETNEEDTSNKDKEEDKDGKKKKKHHKSKAIAPIIVVDPQPKETNEQILKDETALETKESDIIPVETEETKKKKHKHTKESEESGSAVIATREIGSNQETNHIPEEIVDDDKEQSNKLIQPNDQVEVSNTDNDNDKEKEEKKKKKHHKSKTITPLVVITPQQNELPEKIVPSDDLKEEIAANIQEDNENPLAVEPQETNEEEKPKKKHHKHKKNGDKSDSTIVEARSTEPVVVNDELDNKDGSIQELDKKSKLPKDPLRSLAACLININNEEEEQKESEPKSMKHHSNKKKGEDITALPISLNQTDNAEYNKEIQSDINSINQEEGPKIDTKETEDQKENNDGETNTESEKKKHKKHKKKDKDIVVVPQGSNITADEEKVDNKELEDSIIPEEKNITDNDNEKTEMASINGDNEVNTAEEPKKKKHRKNKKGDESIFNTEQPKEDAQTFKEDEKKENSDEEVKGKKNKESDSGEQIETIETILIKNEENDEVKLDSKPLDGAEIKGINNNAECDKEMNEPVSQPKEEETNKDKKKKHHKSKDIAPITILDSQQSITTDKEQEDTLKPNSIHDHQPETNIEEVSLAEYSHQETKDEEQVKKKKKHRKHNKEEENSDSNIVAGRSIDPVKEEIVNGSIKPSSTNKDENGEDSNTDKDKDEHHKSISIVTIGEGQEELAEELAHKDETNTEAKESNVQEDDKSTLLIDQQEMKEEEKIKKKKNHKHKKDDKSESIMVTTKSIEQGPEQVSPVPEEIVEDTKEPKEEDITRTEKDKKEDKAGKKKKHHKHKNEGDESDSAIIATKSTEPSPEQASPAKEEAFDDIKEQSDIKEVNEDDTITKDKEEDRAGKKKKHKSKSVAPVILIDQPQEESTEQQIPNGDEMDEANPVNKESNISEDGTNSLTTELQGTKEEEKSKKKHRKHKKDGDKSDSSIIAIKSIDPSPEQASPAKEEAFGDIKEQSDIKEVNEDDTITKDKEENRAGKKKKHKSKSVAPVILIDQPQEESTEQQIPNGDEMDEANPVNKESNIPEDNINTLTVQSEETNEEEKSKKKHHKHKKEGDKSDSTIVAAKSIEPNTEEDDQIPKEVCDDVKEANEEETTSTDKDGKKKKHHKHKKESDKSDSTIVAAKSEKETNPLPEEIVSKDEEVSPKDDNEQVAKAKELLGLSSNDKETKEEEEQGKKKKKKKHDKSDSTIAVIKSIEPSQEDNNPVSEEVFVDTKEPNDIKEANEERVINTNEEEVINEDKDGGIDGKKKKKHHKSKTVAPIAILDPQQDEKTNGLVPETEESNHQESKEEEKTKKKHHKHKKEDDKSDSTIAATKSIEPVKEETNPRPEEIVSKDEDETQKENNEVEEDISNTDKGKEKKKHSKSKAITPIVGTNEEEPISQTEKDNKKPDEKEKDKKPKHNLVLPLIISQNENGIVVDQVSEATDSNSFADEAEKPLRKSNPSTPRSQLIVKPTKNKKKLEETTPKLSQKYRITTDAYSISAFEFVDTDSVTPDKNQAGFQHVSSFSDSEPVLPRLERKTTSRSDSRSVRRVAIPPIPNHQTSFYQSHQTPNASKQSSIDFSNGLSMNEEQLRARFYAAPTREALDDDDSTSVRPREFTSNDAILEAQTESLRESEAPNVSFSSLMGLIHINSMMRKSTLPRESTSRSITQRPPTRKTTEAQLAQPKPAQVRWLQ